MFISNLERSKISSRLHVLEEMAKNMAERIRVLESDAKKNVMIDKKVLLSEAEKIKIQKEKQKVWSKRYYERKKAKKKNESLPESH
jgi:hypothetical protein